MPVDRITINRICEEISVIRGIDHIAALEATRCIRAAIREVLQTITFDVDEESLRGMITMINRAYNSAQIVDGTMIGAMTAESLAVGINQTAQSLFKMVEKVINLDEAAKRATEIFNTVEDRSTQEIFLHLDRNYTLGPKWKSKKLWQTQHPLPDTIDINRTQQRSLGNYTLHEATQAQSIFVQLTLRDILKNGDTHNAIVGVMERFKGDNVSKSIDKLRKRAIEEHYAPLLQPGLWNRIEALRNRSHEGSVYVLRLYLDGKLMYMNGISIESVIQKINENINSVREEVYTIGSSFSYTEGCIIDIIPAYTTSSRDREMLDSRFLYHHVVQMIDSIIVSGISGIKTSEVKQFKLTNTFSEYKASVYFVGELGRDKWLASEEHKHKDGTVTIGYDDWLEYYNDNHPDQIKGHDSLVDIDYNLVVTETLEESDFPLAFIEGRHYCLSHKVNDDREKPSTEDIDNIYLQYYMGVYDFNNLWMLKLNITTLISDCIDIDLIVNMLYYCGIDIMSIEPHHICKEYSGYIYVVCEEAPSKIIARHKEVSPEKLFDNGESVVFAYEKGKVKSKDYFSRTAEEYILSLVPNPNDWDSVISTLTKLDLSNIFNYYMLILSVSKKGQEAKSKKNDIDKYINSHVYSKVIMERIVDRKKTVSNDWSVMNLIIGVEANRNNYVREVKVLFDNCDIKIDPSNISRHGEYTFMTTGASGVGLSSMIKNEISPFTRATNKEALKNFYASTQAKPESIKNNAVAMLLGAPPIVGRNTASRYVASMEERTRLYRLREQTKLSQASSTYQVSSENDVESAVIKALKNLLEEQDPYISIPKLQITEDLKNKVPPVPTEPYVIFTSKMPGVVEQIKKGMQRRLKDLETRKSYEKPLLVIPSKTTFYDANEITNFALRYFQ